LGLVEVGGGLFWVLCFFFVVFCFWFVVELGCGLAGGLVVGVCLVGWVFWGCFLGLVLGAVENHPLSGDFSDRSVRPA